MARPTDAGSFAEAVYAQMAPVAWDDENQGWALLFYLGALGQMFQQMDTIAHDEDMPWCALLDINEVPDEGVPWLGQFVGTSVDTALDLNTQKQQIRDHDNWSRGTLAYLVRKIQESGGLMGNKTVIVRERAGSPYNFTVITYPAETLPGTQDYEGLYDTSSTYGAVYTTYPLYLNISASALGGAYLVDNAIQAYKPAGLTYTYSVTWPQDYWGIYTTFGSYASLY